ncbi:hypothetical protein LTR85_003469 [Meristemomyces frigidus]|nr:hypothetical protein LTR85_003469 [Meristemomyces frigidus]
MATNFAINLATTANNIDSVSIRNLQLPHGTTAPDVWGKLKEQPALVSLKLVMHGEGFSTSAEEDDLDSSIHYGKLAKAIRAKSYSGQTVDDLLDGVGDIVQEMAVTAYGKKFLLARADLEVSLPKASMEGELVTMTNVLHYNKSGNVEKMDRAFTVRDMKLMVLVGVNSYERDAEQPIVAHVAVSWRCGTTKAGETEVVNKLFGMEQTLVEIIDSTSFGTLETLADHTVRQLQDQLLNQLLPVCRVQLRLEKPRAIAFADAPMVEVIRQTQARSGDSKRRPTVPVTGAATEPQLYIIKPYVG